MVFLKLRQWRVRRNQRHGTNYTNERADQHPDDNELEAAAGLRLILDRAVAGLRRV